ncbi:MAG TPA: YdeI/OmpD-associated family protein [Phycisphaerales bacterium]|nr:YdeI/OmpD-associated family protein [Phycisphaerales bacterium]
MPADVKHIYFKDRPALRAWLTQHHATHAAIWLVYDKGARTARTLSYDDIVEEALCFGWIDSVAGRVSETQSKLYFSPRKPRSVWSALNKRRITSLQQQGLITAAGQAKIDAAIADGSWTTLDAAEALELPADLKRAFAQDAKARSNFNAFPPGARKQALTWIITAKRPETRALRITQTVQLAAQNVRPNAQTAAALRTASPPSKSRTPARASRPRTSRSTRKAR